MRAVSEANVMALGPDGSACAVLRITLLPQSTPNGAVPPLLESQRGDADHDSLAAVQLHEGHEYLYQWTELPREVLAVKTDPVEVFQPDTRDGLKGRLRPGLSTGIIVIQLNCGEASLAQCDIEVRSRKLHYLSEYQWMLRDIADQMAEL